MAALGQRLRSIRQVAAAVIRTSKQLELVNKLKEETIAAEMATADAKLRPVIQQMLMSNYKASGLQNRTGTMERAMAGIIIDIGPNNLFIHMPTGVKYPNTPKGNPYAAAGVFRFGGVRQPRTSTHYTDLSTGERKERKRRAGVFGATVKRAVKRVVLQGGTLTEREARGRSGRALNDFHTGAISVMYPKPPFFQLSDEQRKALLEFRIENARKIFKAHGIPVT